MLSMYVVFSGQLSLFDLVNSRHSRLGAGCSTAELPIAIGFSCAMCQEPPVRLQLREYQTASGGFLPGTKSRSLFGESPATWHQDSPRFLHEFSTNSPRILEDFLIFGKFQSFRCKSLQVTFSPCETGPFCLESS